jgi:hypothetical protein
MPTALIKKLHKEGKGSIAQLETKWKLAKQKAAAQKHADDFDYITTVFLGMANSIKAYSSEPMLGDRVDTVTIDVPLLIRLMELAREELKTDEQLHDVVTNIIAISKEIEPLGMKDYDRIVAI